MCSSGSQAQDLGGGWSLSLACTVNHDSGTCPSDLAALTELYYGKQLNMYAIAHWKDKI